LEKEEIYFWRVFGKRRDIFLEGVWKKKRYISKIKYSIVFYIKI